ncbi:ABC transporter substrate-binding protein [Consotaella aegiceratis]|uniref:ABC transporter substrate-binding protein n=1 Tax=Consotaella aegiceratis TaxID=3097961 RepID=UPI002F3F8DEB
MTLSDLPTTTGMPSQGGEGMRFAGYPIFEPLVAWQLRTNTDQRATFGPGLATSWEIDPDDETRWIFHLRQGVKFHDGSLFDADAVIWNLERFWNEKAPQYEASASGIARSRVPQMASWNKIDDKTVAIATHSPSSYFPQSLTQLPLASPAQYNAVGGDWTKFATSPSGTGPFRITEVVAHQSITLAKNPDYWDSDHVPKLDQIKLIPMPDANTRLAALRSGQVDWVEVPPPDAIPGLKAAGYTISMKIYPHIWPYIFSFKEGSPFLDKRVRQAANFAIDRDGLVFLLNDTVSPASGFVPPEDVSYGHPSVKYTYDPDRAKALLAEAGYGPDKKVPLKVLTSSSGSGQLLPVQMNQLIQQNLNEVGFDVDIEVLEWGQLVTAFRQEQGSDLRENADAINMSLSFPGAAEWERWFYGKNVPPVGSNWGYWKNDEFDALIDKVGKTFDPDEVDTLLAQAHEILVEEAPWVFIVHDKNPRALSQKVKGFDPAQSWYQDFTGIWME